MPTVDVVDLNNQKVGQVELSDIVFGAEVNQDLLYESVRHYLAGTRAGTHKVKTRHEVAGSGKKLWKQKGTGRARMGSVRSPIWRHGGTVHGPVPRDYSYKLPRKMQLGALRSALSAKLRDGELLVISAFQLADHKTKNFTRALGKFEASKSAKRKVLLVETEENRNLELSARNLEGVMVVRSHEVHPYQLLDATRVLLTQAAASKLSETLAKSAPKSAKSEKTTPEGNES
jgi:large subunit ribosomal protein L4